MLRRGGLLLLTALLAMTVATPSARADTIAQTSGTISAGYTLESGVQALEGGWSMTNGYDDVTITAEVGGQSGGSITAYLTTQIGSGTTSADEIASYTFTPGSVDETVTFFSGLNLAAGTYFLTLTGSSTNNQWWWGTVSPQITTADDAMVFTDGHSGVNNGPLASNAPASTFHSSGLGLIFAVTGDPVATAEPSSMLLCCLALFALALFARGKSQRKRSPDCVHTS